MYKIFVLDDEPSIGIIVNLNLKDTFQISTGQSVSEFKKHVGDIEGMVLDLNIGSDSGLDVLKSIRKGEYNHIHPQIPVIILSAEEDSKTKIHALENGADDFMVKPFNPRELKARMKRMFERINAFKNG